MFLLLFHFFLRVQNWLGNSWYSVAIRWDTVFNKIGLGYLADISDEKVSLRCDKEFCTLSLLRRFREASDKV